MYMRACGQSWALKWVTVVAIGLKSVSSIGTEMSERKGSRKTCVTDLQYLDERLCNSTTQTTRRICDIHIGYHIASFLEGPPNDLQIFNYTYLSVLTLHMSRHTFHFTAVLYYHGVHAFAFAAISAGVRIVDMFMPSCRVHLSCRHHR
jgi:hypothetical protein